MSNSDLHSGSPRSSIYRQLLVVIRWWRRCNKELLLCLNYTLVYQCSNLLWLIMVSESIFGDKRWLPISFSCGNFSSGRSNKWQLYSTISIVLFANITSYIHIIDMYLCTWISREMSWLGFLAISSCISKPVKITSMDHANSVGFQ